MFIWSKCLPPKIVPYHSKKRYRLNEERKNYLLLLSIYKLRNIASHREEGKTIIQRIENINYNVFKNKVSELYNLKPYLSIKKTIHWFICRCNQWIPPQARR